MKQKITLLLSCLISTIAYSQSTNQGFLDWKTTDGTQNFFYKNVTKTDGLGNVYVAGATINGAGNTDILLAKYNSAGVQLWIQQYAGSGNGHDFAAGLAVTNTDVYVTGAVTTSTNLTTDVITMHYSSAGVLQWATTYNGTGNAFDSGKFLVIDGSNNVYVTGGSYNASGNIDFVTVKYSSTGTQQWVSLYDYSASLDDAGINIATNGSNVVVTGVVTSTTNNYKVATLTYAQSTGSLTATNVGTATTTSSVTAVTDLGKDVSGNIYIVGSTYVSGQGQNYYVQKLSNALVTQWTYTYNGSSNLDDIAKGIQLDASSNVYVTGYSTSSTQGRDITTVKLNSSGTQQWIQTINSITNGDDEGADMVIDASANIYIAGYIASDINQSDYYTVKYNSSGTKIWDILTDGNHLNDRGTNIALDSLNNVIVTGQSETVPNTFQFLTTKYVQMDVITPTDFNGETPKSNALYYENKGQLVSTTLTAVPDVKFYTNNTYPSHYIKSNSSSFVFAKIDTVASTNDTLNRIDITFDGVNASKTYPMEIQKDGYLNYYLAHTGSTGVSTVFGNQRLITPEIYRNIDLMYSSNQNGIKYYYIIKPGGNPADIKLTFTGASTFSLNGTTNDLTIYSTIGKIKFDRPTVYQLSSTNATIAVTGWTPDWQTNGASNKYKFNTGTYTSSLTLVIEVDQGNSTVSSTANHNLTWCTYYGGASEDVFFDVKTNSSNNVWVTGYSTSINFPTVNSYQGTYAGNMDAIFVKFSTLGVRQWATYIGGSNAETDYHINGIEVDNLGNSYSAFRTTSTNFPVKSSFLSGEYYDNTNTNNSIAVVSFNNIGQLTWGTYFGHTNSNITTYDVGLDNNNNLILLGTIGGAVGGIPTLNPSGSYVNSHSLTSGCFISKFDSNHNLVWSTYLGNANQYAEKISVNSSNEIIVVGELYSTSVSSFDFVNPAGGAYFDNSFNGGSYDGYIMKFNGSSYSLNWSTLFGGNNDDKIHAVINDNSNNIYISGETESTSSLISGNSLGLNYTTYGGTGTYYVRQIGDSYLTKFGSSNQYISSTYFGGGANDASYDIAYKNNTLFIPFVTAGNDVPFYGSNPSTAFVQATNSNGQDVANDGFFALMDNNFNFLWSSYFGGSNTSTSNPLAMYDEINSNIPSNDSKYYIVGSTFSNLNFPITNLTGAYNQPTMGSGHDAYIAQFDISTLPVSVKELKSNNVIDNLLIFPNPTNNVIYINYLSTDKYKLEIMDIIGRQIYALENQNSSMLKIDVSNFAKGTYIVKVSNKDNTSVKKLIID